MIVNMYSNEKAWTTKKGELASKEPHSKQKRDHTRMTYMKEKEVNLITIDEMTLQ